MMPLGLIATSPVSGSRALMLPPVHVTRPFLGNSRCNFQSCSLSCSSIIYFPFHWVLVWVGVWGGLRPPHTPPIWGGFGGGAGPPPPPPTNSFGGYGPK